MAITGLQLITGIGWAKTNSWHFQVCLCSSQLGGQRHHRSHIPCRIHPKVLHFNNMIVLEVEMEDLCLSDYKPILIEGLGYVFSVQDNVDTVYCAQDISFNIFRNSPAARYLASRGLTPRCYHTICSQGDFSSSGISTPLDPAGAMML